MGILKNAQQELFVQNLVSGQALNKAYSNAGYSPSNSAGARLRYRPHVAKRVAELLSRGARKTVVTVEKLTEELEEARTLAMSDEKGAAAAVSAIMAKAKLHGLDVNKMEFNGGFNITISSDDDKL